ncbi:ParB/RepB/Spo0J family partition protein [Streptomyces aureus]|uniref:ParB/RepB/Spo0J family partition protein n=1 Tax=Streptomyces aureus TaxID=193461 RepID=UPI0006E37146|nr:ParB N-terminal domain-containing protein [Streptomyces aureus]
MDGAASCRTDLLDRVGRAAEKVPIASLDIAHSPRRAGLDVGHVRLLAESGTAPPPIIVQRGTLRVIDGVHRVKAARQLGHDTIEARLFDGTDEDAFVLAVELNSSHGLPLSLGDRTAAATRILVTHPAWSDRRIARTTGLSPSTVGNLRRRATVQIEHLDSRTGSDGRERPVNSASGRLKAGRVLTEQPNLSLREVARLAGVAPSTVRDVRDRLRAGEEVVPRQRSGLRPGESPTAPAAPPSPAAASGASGASHPSGTSGASHPSGSSRSPQPPGASRSSGFPGFPGPPRPPVDGDQARGRPVPARFASRGFDRQATLESLRNDPSIRFNNAGRELLRLLNLSSVEQASLERIVNHVPPHWAGTVAELIRNNAEAWTAFAAALEQRRGVRDAS